MKKVVPALILILLAVIAVFSLFSDKGYDKLSSLERGLELQLAKNSELSTEVSELRKRVIGLTTNDRVLEKTARNELGMARENELIFIFEKETTSNEQ